NSKIRHTKQLSLRKHNYGVALYPPPEVGGFTAMLDKKAHRLICGLLIESSLYFDNLFTSLIYYRELQR
ncbi:hypothetical protein, partial [Psychrobacter piechaudii]|uniref:hypothetical protein n=1 Tax=Psychrobacter piechaudii TaxID=1945521 RepID=UPI001ABF87F3